MFRKVELGEDQAGKWEGHDVSLGQLVFQRPSGPETTGLRKRALQSPEFKAPVPAVVPELNLGRRSRLPVSPILLVCQLV